MNIIICHYSEIALKKGNRGFFEEKLIKNIKNALPGGSFESVKMVFGRVVVKLKPNADKRKITENIKKVFGISNFSFAIETASEIKKIREIAFKLLSKLNFDSFKIFAKRANKNFPLTSQQINEKIGEYILKKIKNIKVNLDNPEAVCFIEIVNNRSFLYSEKIKGPGGLPMGTSGKICVLLSGGIDSPVAAYKIMRRGAEAVFLHFHSYPQTNAASIEKIKSIVKILEQYQGKSKLYLIPFLDIQKEIFKKAPEKLRVVLYRRFMLKIAQKIAERENALAIATGDSLGQVASQTLENIYAINEAAKMPVFRPLIGLDKEEIIKQAREIETYEISIQPHEDCCSLFIPAHPETKASLKDIKNVEKKLNVSKFINAAIKKINSEFDSLRL